MSKTKHADFLQQKIIVKFPASLHLIKKKQLSVTSTSLTVSYYSAKLHMELIIIKLHIRITLKSHV